MTKGELLTMLIRQAKDYCAQGIEESLDRNSHMHDKFDCFDQKLAEAVLTDYLNYVGMKQGLDLGLYTRDL